MTEDAVAEFNRRANQTCYMTSNYWGVHLVTCKRWDGDPCICDDLLRDPGRIFDESISPSQVPKEEAADYFNWLARKHGKKYLMIRRDGHLVDCTNNRSNVKQCPCARLLRDPERFFRIQNRFNRSRLNDTEIRDLKLEWAKTGCRQEKFNVLCRLLGKTIRYVRHEGEYHLYTCSWSFRTVGPPACGCNKPVEYPFEFFVESILKNSYKLRGEEGYHHKECTRVETLVSPKLYDEFPEHIECDCKKKKM